MRTISEIIVHCTATPEGHDYSVDDIRRWHVARGFADIGYHYIIHLDGAVSKGRDINQPGAHCVGHNAGSIGIAYVGGLASDKKTPKDTRTDKQKASLRNLLRELHSAFPRATVHGHREFAQKACPCFDVNTQL